MFKGQFQAYEYKEELIITQNIYTVSLFGLLKLLQKTIKNQKFKLIWASLLKVVKWNHVTILTTVFTIALQKHYQNFVWRKMKILYLLLFWLFALFFFVLLKRCFKFIFLHRFFFFCFVIEG